MGTNDSAKPDHQFPNTRWSVVLQAQGSDSAVRHRALEQICRTYWLPIYAYARGQGLSPADAEDLTQNVLSDLLNRQVFEKVAAEKGKLRSFLRVATKKFPPQRLEEGASSQARRRCHSFVAGLRGCRGALHPGGGAGHGILKRFSITTGV